ncbi:hypothetical protein P43SY_006952 [Pythium insidiosum]|uniref:NECAP PHear domain-containing protein n=1 Tax=Pythium insidiosum TaxID=114742 RepID=A0AAD5Q2F5_PYTIN|nr:hypothetical protein P43SY_006952 [Pythium insidiosum]
MTDDAAIELEQTLFQDQRVWFYQVPPAQVTTLSPRADAWDPEHPFMTGALRVLQKGDACWVRLYEPLGADAAAERTLFAQCPVEITPELPLEVYVQDCADSSRYFLLRVEDDTTKRRAYIGIGFAERGSALDFKAALLDYVKYVHRMHEAAALAAAGPRAADGAPSPSKSQDLSIPKGATIRINLKINSGTDGERMRRRSSSSSADESPGVAAAKVPLLPPPPADPATALLSPTSQAAAAVEVADEDWGDFTSASS